VAVLPFLFFILNTSPQFRGLSAPPPQVGLRTYLTVGQEFLVVSREAQISSDEFEAENKVNKIQQDATICRYLFTAKSIYMCRVSIAPIIRSTKIVTAASGAGHSLWATAFLQCVLIRQGWRKAITQIL
jgi:hypothetical protein